MAVNLNHTILGHAFVVKKNKSLTVYSTDELWEQPSACIAALQTQTGFFFFTRSFWPTILRHAEMKSCSPVIGTDVGFLLSGLLHIICYCFTPVKGHSSWPRLQACKSFSSSRARSRLRGHERLEQGVADVIVSVSNTTARIGSLR